MSPEPVAPHRQQTGLLQAIGDALCAALTFLWRNSAGRDPRASRRHNWRWVIFVFIDAILFGRPGAQRTRTGTLVVLVNRLGDAIISKPLIDALRADAERRGEPFVVLGDRSWQALGDSLYADTEVHFVDERRVRLDLLYRLSVLRWIRAQAFRRAICFMHHRLEMRDDALIALSGATERVVSAPPFLEYRWYPWIFEFYLARMTRIVPQPSDPSGPPQVLDAAGRVIRRVPHVIDRLRHFQAEVLGTPWRCGLIAAQSTPPRADAYAVLSFGASNAERRWPLDEYAATAVRLAERGYHIVFVGGPAEEPLLPALRAALERHALDPHCVSLAVATLSIGELVPLLAGAACFLGTDTGGSHLALWSGAPTVTILHADATMEAYHRLGDFFPYPPGALPSRYAAVWATRDEFQRIADPNIRRRVWKAIDDVLLCAGRGPATRESELGRLSAGACSEQTR